MYNPKETTENKSNPQKSIRLIILFLLSTVCLVLSWHSDATAFFIFLSFVPVFMIFDRQPFSYDEKVLVIILSFLFVFVSAYLTTYWIRNVNPPTHFVIALLRGITMMLPFLAAFLFLFKTKKRRNAPVIAFVTAWLMMEILHDLNILGMSYGNLGHVLAAYPGMIQWYSIMGTIGGTAWILLVNYAIYFLLQPLRFSRFRFPRFGRVSDAGLAQASTESYAVDPSQTTIPSKVPSRKITNTALVILAAAFPVLISLIIYRAPAKTSATNSNVVAVHTSMDVYDFKYEVAPEVLLQSYIRTSKKGLQNSKSQYSDIEQTEQESVEVEKAKTERKATRKSAPINTYKGSGALNIIFWPENALTGNLFAGNLNCSEAVKIIRRDLINETQSVVVTGAIIDRKVPTPVPGSYHPQILRNKEENYYFRRYNTALYIRPEGVPVMKVKKRLVPLSEQVPVKKIFAPLVSLIPNLEDLNFSPADDSYITYGFDGGEVRTSPVICYGSVFSAFTADEIKHTGSDFMAIILNEGWMKSPKAHMHFNWFAICRAVENRRFLVKSSNEGISAFINSKGIVIEQRSGTTNEAIITKLRVNDRLTFYTRYHKYILLGILIAGTVILFLLRYNNKTWLRNDYENTEERLKKNTAGRTRPCSVL